MKTTLLPLGLLGLLLATTRSVPAASEPAALSSPRAKAEATASLPTSPTASLTRAEAQQVILRAQKYEAHPPPGGEARVSTPDFVMAEPPPPARAESRPPIPVAGYVWVPGHYMPVAGSWRWVQGEWAQPATPISVWIPARYDSSKKIWTPGYWQPDRPDGYGDVAANPSPSPSREREVTKH
jgi:hypothetical protein